MLSLSSFIDKIYLLVRDISDAFEHLWALFYVKIYLLIILLTNILNWSLVYWVVGKISNSYDDIIILHYNVDFGVSLIKKVGWFYVIPLLGSIISIINFLLLIFVYNHKDRKFIAHLLFSTTILVNIFLLFGIIAIFLVNYF